MKFLDLDMDYFLRSSFISSVDCGRLPESEYSSSVWAEKDVRDFFENNLGLSRNHKLKGRVVKRHEGSLLLWRELIEASSLTVPFEVIHVDSHADMGLVWYSTAWRYILDELLSYPVKERPLHNAYQGIDGKTHKEEEGDYLLFGMAYRWISKITYCANPYIGCPNDVLWFTLKDLNEGFYDTEAPSVKTIQLLYNSSKKERPKLCDSDDVKQAYIGACQKEPEIPLQIIPTIEDVKYNGDFDYVVMAQSAEYTPASADFIMDIFKEYIIEI